MLGGACYKPIILFSLLSVVIGTVSSVFTIPVKKIESRRSKMLREGTRLERKPISFVSRPPYSIRVKDYDDLEYIGEIRLGTPGSSLFVILDTGSADFWIPDSSCGLCDFFCHGLPKSFCHKLCDKICCTEITSFPFNRCGKQAFDAGSSSTYQAQNGTWLITYGSGLAAGFYGRDVIDLAGMRFNVKFGQATGLDTTMLNSPTFDGILGLAFQSLSVDHTVPPFLAAVQQGIVEKPIFTAFLRRMGSGEAADGGLYTFGGVDTINCESNITYVSLSSATYFQFVMDKFSFGGTQMGDTNVQVISDTGTSFIGAPGTVIRRIAIRIGAMEDNYGYSVPCRHEKLPDMELTIGGKPYFITSDNYIVDMGVNQCYLAMTPIEGMGPSWILGDVFIREYCNIHDMGDKRIGFAKAIQRRENSSYPYPQ